MNGLNVGIEKPKTPFKASEITREWLDLAVTDTKSGGRCEMYHDKYFDIDTEILELTDEMIERVNELNDVELEYEVLDYDTGEVGNPYIHIQVTHHAAFSNRINFMYQALLGEERKKMLFPKKQFMYEFDGTVEKLCKKYDNLYGLAKKWKQREVISYEKKSGRNGMYYRLELKRPYKDGNPQPSQIVNLFPVGYGRNKSWSFIGLATPVGRGFCHD